MYPCCVLKTLKFQYTLYPPRNPIVCFVHMAGAKLSGDLTTQELACICSTYITHVFLCSCVFSGAETIPSISSCKGYAVICLTFQLDALC